MESLNSKRGIFCGLLILSAVFYLVDCLMFPYLPNIPTSRESNEGSTPAARRAS